MRPFDGRVELQFALRDVANSALVVADLRTSGMIDARREIHVVVAGSARHSAGFRQVSLSLGGSGILVVANFATARVGGMDNG